MIRFSKIKNSDINEKIILALSLTTIAVLMIAPTALIESYAAEDSELVWQLVFIKEGTCSPTDNLGKVYASLTSKYFELYQLENKSFEVLCLSEMQYKDFKTPQDVNLLILVYDQELGKKILQPNKLDGIYVHLGNDRSTNHLVIMCDCSDFDSGYESTLPSWILSHELSHFVLSYKGFSQSDIEEKIHELEHEYDNCVGTNFGNEECNAFKVKIRPDLAAKDFVVMAPYEPAVGNKLINYVVRDDSELINLQRELTKMWITNMIDDKAYTNTLKHLVDPQTENVSNVTEPFMKIPNGFVIAEFSKPKEIDWNEYLNHVTNEQKTLQPLLDYIPFNLEEKIQELNIEKMPNWFKTRALLWSEKRISDKVFFDGVEHLVRMGTLKLD